MGKQCEKKDKRIAELEIEAKRLNGYAEYLYDRIDICHYTMAELRRSNAALRGVITKLKNRLGYPKYTTME